MGIFRIGHGYDIHRFKSNIEESSNTDQIVTLCGVKMNCHSELEAHSDGDVATHALMDAILGAAGEPDIGNMFPNTDNKWENASSIDMLSAVLTKVTALGYSIGNIDLTIVAETPKISPHLSDMKNIIANALAIERSQVGIKATTNEKIGSIGRSEGICAMAVALLLKQQLGKFNE